MFNHGFISRSLFKVSKGNRSSTKNALQVANSANLWSNTQNFLVNKKVEK